MSADHMSLTFATENPCCWRLPFSNRLPIAFTHLSRLRPRIPRAVGAAASAPAVPRGRSPAALVGETVALGDAELPEFWVHPRPEQRPTQDALQTALGTLRQLLREIGKTSASGSRSPMEGAGGRERVVGVFSHSELLSRMIVRQHE
jgi:hypothetical protein